MGFYWAFSFGLQWDRQDYQRRSRRKGPTGKQGFDAVTKGTWGCHPILLIDENDVIAGHAASVGRINQDQLYYLMSRGLTKDVAQRLVARGFLGVVLSDIPVAEVRQQMIALIERKLTNGQGTE